MRERERERERGVVRPSESQVSEGEEIRHRETQGDTGRNRDGTEPTDGCLRRIETRFTDETAPISVI